MASPTSGSQDYFEAVAGDWEKIRAGFFSPELAQAAFGVASLKPDTLAVDVGAGAGFLTRGLLAQGLHVIAVDRSEAMIRVLRELDPGKGILDVRMGEACRLPISSATADYVFANMLLHHVEEPQAAVCEMVRTLKPCGKLVITDLDLHGHQFLIEEHHDHWPGFDRKDIRRWFLESGLYDVTVDGTGCDCCPESSFDSARISIFVASGKNSPAPISPTR